MTSTRSFVIAFMILMVLCGAAVAQRPGPQFRRELLCEPYDRTKLESLEASYEKILIKGFTPVANLNVRGVVIRVDAVEMRIATASQRALGIVISLRGAGDPPNENRSYIDYEEIEPLLKALDSVARVNESATKLVGFEARYRTLGDLEVVVFRQSRVSGTAVSLSSGLCNKVTAYLTLDELDTLRAHMIEAKARLDEIK